VACNSIEVSAIGDIAAAADVPVVGVIAPGVRAALRATRNGKVGVIGTEATIRTGGYQRAVGSGATLVAAACPVFVEHVERGDTTSAALRSAAAGYLAPLEQEGVDTVIMGCTHYPLLSGLLQLELGPDVVLVSSAEETAKDVYAELVRGDALRDAAGPPTHTFATTGDADAFRDLAERVLGLEIARVDAAAIGEDAA
jgi:glutamate racemase